MWDSETQRLGMKACTPVGYFLREVGDFIGFLGMIPLLLVPVFLMVQGVRHKFSAHELWLLLVPFLVGVIGRVFYETGWFMAEKKQYKYHYDSNSVTWVEGGREKCFRHSS